MLKAVHAFFDEHEEEVRKQHMLPAVKDAFGHLYGKFEEAMSEGDLYECAICKRICRRKEGTLSRKKRENKVPAFCAEHTFPRFACKSTYLVI